MFATFKRRQTSQRQRGEGVVPFSVSDNGVASVPASVVLQSPGAKEQLEAVKRLRLAFNASSRK